MSIQGETFAAAQRRQNLNNVKIFAAVGAGLAAVFGVAHVVEMTKTRARDAAMRALQADAQQLISATSAMPNPCEGARGLHRFSTERLRSGAAGELPIVDLVSRAHDSRMRACCEWRRGEIVGGVRRLGQNGVPEGQTRSSLLAVIGAAAEQAEEQMATFPICGGQATLDQLTVAMLVERALELEQADAWRGYARIVQSDEAGSSAFSALLFSPERRLEIAGACLSRGSAEAERVSRAGDNETALGMYRDIGVCMEKAPAGVVFSAAQRRRVLQALAQAASRVRAAEAAAAHEGARREATTRRSVERTARSCMTNCQRGGTDIWECAGRCARLHPEVAGYNVDY